MIQDQEPEGSTSISKTSAYNEPPETAEAENSQLIVDFDNIEDILDFSLDSPTEASNGNSDKKRPPRLRKMTAQEPIKLLELKPIIDNFVHDDEYNNPEDDVDYENETRTKRRFQCIVCGSKFKRSTHLHRHMRLHTGAKPYACCVCRKRFSRSDYKSAHEHSHRTGKIHCCCVCGEVFFDLTRFAYHCRSHDDSEYIRVAMANTPEENEACQVQVAKDEIPVAIAAKEIVLNSCVVIEKVDNSTNEECIMCIKNPIYASHDQPKSNGVTSVSGTNLNDGTRTINGLIVSVAVSHNALSTMKTF